MCAYSHVFVNLSQSKTLLIKLHFNITKTHKHIYTHTDKLIHTHMHKEVSQSTKSANITKLKITGFGNQMLKDLKELQSLYSE